MYHKMVLGLYMHAGLYVCRAYAGVVMRGPSHVLLVLVVWVGASAPAAVAGCLPCRHMGARMDSSKCLHMHTCGRSL